MSLATEVSALRSSAGLSHPTHIAMVMVDGPSSLDLLQRASSQSPYVREGRVRHTLLLREDGGIFADALIVKVEEAFLVLAEGPSEEELCAWLQAQNQDGVAIRGMSHEWRALGVDGPYAWEVVAHLLGPRMLGLPYLALLRSGEVLCMRIGKTGEYGYLLLVPNSEAAGVEARLREAGAALDLVDVSCEALDVCALEGWHFSMRNLRTTDYVSPLTPIELQLQWRVSYTREFVGAAALRLRRAEARVRATCFIAEGPVSAGQNIQLGAMVIGEVLVARASPTLGRIVGSALLERRFAHPHLTLAAQSADGPLPILTCTASLVDNLSLRIDPHKHSYATRAPLP